MTLTDDILTSGVVDRAAAEAIAVKLGPGVALTSMPVLADSPDLVLDAVVAMKPAVSRARATAGVRASFAIDPTIARRLVAQGWRVA